MLGVLIEIFRSDPVAAGLRLPRERDITLEHLIGVAANFYVRPVAVESLHPMRQARPVVVARRTASAAMWRTAAAIRRAAAAIAAA